ncbi:MAG: patatin-like phospholipase family protein [Planctomyces sp.]|jgi:NTE family protein
MVEINNGAERTNRKSESGVMQGNLGSCLCLSGGGFRATLFHLGVLTRLNELGVLSTITTFSSVSGGSILNGFLACNWDKLEASPDGVFKNFTDVIVEPVRRFCAKDLRTALLLGVRLNPKNWISLLRDRMSVSANFLAEAYEPVFSKKLSELPQNGPRFIFCATNVLTGACWHFHGGLVARMGDFYTGYCDATAVRVSDAVAASSAFPPGFSALKLSVPAKTEFSRTDPWGELRVVSAKRGASTSLTATKIFLTDGGVYDNLGVEPVWKSYKTLLVSDAGRPFGAAIKCDAGAIRRLSRASEISMEQVAAVRKRWLVDQFLSTNRFGTLWTLNTRLGDFPLPEKTGYGPEAARLIQAVRTDLDAFTQGEIACLENHGYSLSDAAVRSYASQLCKKSDAPFRWPSEVLSSDERACDSLKTSHRRKVIRDIFRYLSGLFA